MLKPTIRIQLAALLLTSATCLAQSTAAQPSPEPTNDKEAHVAQAPAGVVPLTPAEELAYKQFLATRSPDELAWETLLHKDLGPFYFPGHLRAAIAGKPEAWTYVKDDPKLPRLIIVGDSISRGYTTPLRTLLKGKYNVHRAPANCGSTKDGLRDMAEWLGPTKWDLILFNFGIHDRGDKPEAYHDSLTKVVALLKNTGAKLEWVRTTPFGASDDPIQQTQGAMVNRIADQVMKENNVPEIDLYTAVLPHLAEWQVEKDHTHFKDPGYDFLAQQIVASIAMH